MLDEEFNQIVTKNELINILYERNINPVTKSSSLTIEEINNIIDVIVENEERDNEVYNFFDVSVWDDFLHKVLMEKNITKEFGNLFFFMVNNDKYIYLNPIKEENDIMQFDYILNKKINEGKKESWLRKKRTKYIDIFKKRKEQNKPITEKYKE